MCRPGYGCRCRPLHRWSGLSRSWGCRRLPKARIRLRSAHRVIHRHEELLVPAGSLLQETEVGDLSCPFPEENRSI